VQDTLSGPMLVGLNWGIGHLPYYLALLPREQLAAHMPLDLAAYLSMVLISTRHGRHPLREVAAQDGVHVALSGDAQGQQRRHHDAAAV